MPTMLSELYFALLDAGASEEKARKAAEAVASHDTRFTALEGTFVALEARMEQRFTALEGKFAVLEAKVEQRFTALEGKFAALEAKVEQRCTALEGKFTAMQAEFRGDITRMTWMFGTTVAFVGAIFWKMFTL